MISLLQRSVNLSVPWFGPHTLGEGRNPLARNHLAVDENRVTGGPERPGPPTPLRPLSRGAGPPPIASHANPTPPARPAVVLCPGEKQQAFPHGTPCVNR